MATETMTRTGLTELLRQDHRRMKKLFEQFEDARDEQRKSIASEALNLIALHDVIEQTLLYPAVAKESSISRNLVLRCEEAHHVVHLLLAELKVRPYNDRYFAKFSKMSEGILAHIDEEENELFPAIERSRIDNAELGRRMQELKESRGAMLMRSMGAKSGAFAGVALIAGIGWAVYKAFSSQE